MNKLKIAINTGTVWVKTFIVDGNKDDDLLALIEEYVQNNKDDFRTYSYNELLNIYDNDDCLIEENHLPINGGEYYIDSVEWVEEIVEE